MMGMQGLMMYNDCMIDIVECMHMCYIIVRMFLSVDGYCQNFVTGTSRCKRPVLSISVTLLVWILKIRSVMKTDQERILTTRLKSRLSTE